MAAKILLPLTVAGVGIAGGTAAFATYKTSYSSKKPKCINYDSLNEKIKELKQKLEEKNENDPDKNLKDLRESILESCKKGLGDGEEEIFETIFNPIFTPKQILSELEKILKIN